MKELNGKTVSLISGGNGQNVSPYGAIGVVAPDYWYMRINANITLADNTYISPHVTYVDQMGFINPGIQITYILD